MPDAIEHVLTPFLRRRPVDEATANFLHALYLMLRNTAPSTMTEDSKQRTFESAAVGAHHWEVVAISEEAIKALRDGKGQGAVRRGHPLARRDRYRHLFGAGTEEVSRDELIGFYFEHDATALVSVEENNKAGTEHWSKLYQVDRDGLFVAAGYGVKLRVKTELKWIEQLQAQIESTEAHES